MEGPGKVTVMTLANDSKELVKQSVDLAYPGETVASLMERTQDGGVHRILEYTVSRREVPK
jgi:hypothetical protein